MVKTPPAIENEYSDTIETEYYGVCVCEKHRKGKSGSFIGDDTILPFCQVSHCFEAAQWLVIIESAN